jgi:hypothetical protein
MANGTLVVIVKIGKDGVVAETPTFDIDGGKNPMPVKLNEKGGIEPPAAAQQELKYGANNSGGTPLLSFLLSTGQWSVQSVQTDTFPQGGVDGVLFVKTFLLVNQAPT